MWSEATHRTHHVPNFFLLNPLTADPVKALHFAILAPRTERQSARMSKFKNGGLDQYGAEPFEQQQFRTAGVEGVNPTMDSPWSSVVCNLCCTRSNKA